MNIVLGVTGSISAYKAAEIANQLTKDGHNVDVILTDGGSRFITAMTLQTLSKNEVHTDMFDESNPKLVKHIALADAADVVLIAPASANTIAKIAGGIADNLLTATVLAAADQAKIYVAPAMNTHMYENPITQDNIAKLQKYGFNIIEPKSSHLACGTTGKGALADVETIIKTVEGSLD